MAVNRCFGALTARALYSSDHATAQDANAAWRALAQTLRAMREHAPWWRRAIAALDPRTFTPERSVTWARSQMTAVFGRA